MEPERLDQKFQGFIFDLDGTVYLGETLIPGADETILSLRNWGKKLFSCLTNRFSREGSMPAN